MKKTFTVLIAFMLVVVAIAMIPEPKPVPSKFYTREELLSIHKMPLPPLDSDEYFVTPAQCKGCHGYDPLGLALVDANGADINIFDDWETSMMGLSSVDPLWRAKVSHEIQVNPAHALELQTFCTRCHAPMGHFTAFYHNLPYYTLADLAADSLGVSGVGCHGCHAIDSTNLGHLFSGNIPYDTNNVAYGPFTAPMQGPMQLYVGLTPAYSSHVSQGKFCSPCHTLFTSTVDLNGNPTGGSFAEQATFHEWENSVYPANDTTCQTCHMPQIEDPVKIAVGYTALPGRSPFNIHSFEGANSFMVKLIKNNKASLGVNASDANFDSTLAAINRQLTQNALKVKLASDSIVNDSAYFSVTVTNKAGHKFPSGYPSRRAVLQFVATKTNGDTIFASGLFDINGEVININTPYENHYDVINDAAQIQIYEMVAADVNGNKTTVLERLASNLKDNRIPPAGFTTIHSNYDTCKITGNALTDSDFNKINSVEGTGRDIVHYHVSLNGYSGLVNVKASVFYQSVPPAWLTEMFTYSSAEIDSFEQMYNAESKEPVLVGKDSLQNIINPAAISSHLNPNAISISPNPTNTAFINISGLKGIHAEIKIYNSNGELFLFKPKTLSNEILQLHLPKASGIYYINIVTSKGSITKKVLKL